MVFPVTHVLVPMLIVETYRRYFAARDRKGRVLFSKWYVFFAGFMGGAADFDFFVGLVMTGGFDSAYHRGLTHSLFIPLAVLVVGLVLWQLHSRQVLRYDGWKVSYTLMLIAALSFSSHTLLDGITGFHQWLFPLEWYAGLPNLITTKYRAALLDGIVLFVWILYDEKYLYDILGWFGVGKKK